MPQDQDAPIRWTNALPSIPEFFASLSAGRSCPGRIAVTEESAALKLLTLTVALIIFVLARGLVAGAPQELTPAILATVISAVIVFIAGYGVLIVQPGDAGQQLARQWAVYFVYISGSRASFS
jgi:uncharacterized membrane protein